MHEAEGVHGATGPPEILIVGASSGIGEALHRHFKAAGRKVVGTYKNNKRDGMVWLDTHNVQFLKTYLDGWARRMTLIHCAGMNHDGMGHRMDPLEFRHCLNENILSAFNVARYALPSMRKHEWGRIIFFGSVVPDLGVAGTPAYSAAKAALWGLTKTLAIENASLGITVNCLDLGYFEMGMGTRLTAPQKQAALGRIPQSRFGTAEAVVAAVEFLERCDYITGERVRVAGGL